MKLLTYEVHLLRENLFNRTKCIKLPYVCQAKNLFKKQRVIWATGRNQRTGI